MQKMQRPLERAQMSRLKENHTNGEWLEFIDDLESIASLLEDLQAPSLAETVISAAETLVKWNPERIESIKRCTEVENDN